MGDEIRANTKVADPRGDGVDGRVVELKGREALVAFDDGRVSEWIAVKYLTPKVGRPKGSGVREPVEPKRAIKVECVLRDVIVDEMARQNLTWEALSERSGVSRATIARIISGNGAGQRIDTVEALARALCVAPGRFWIVTPA